MEFNFQWLLIGLPIAFALGWMASRFDLRQVRREDRDRPRAYFKGLNFLLNEQQDKAIDAFIEAVQNDPDTAELHFALGNLFRRRGEFQRAVRVHEHLLARADLKTEDRDRAQRALAQDFMQAGLFDRAEAAWQSLEGSSFQAEARLALLALYERSRDWDHATQVARQLEAQGAGQFGARIAHYQCERALALDAAGDAEQALAAYAQASAAAPQAARPWVELGQRQWRAGDAAAAMASWQQLQTVQPAAFNLVALEYAQAAQQAGRTAEALALLRGQYAQAPSSALMRAQLALLNPSAGPAAAELLAQHLKTQPTLSAAQAALAPPPSEWGVDTLQGIRAAVDRAVLPVQRYRCAACGFEARHWFWQCPGCLSWDSFPPLPIEEQ